MGNTQIALSALPADSPLNYDIEQVRKAAQKAADLTKQLLIFSRKQVLQLNIIDVNVDIKNLEKMLRRMIREDIDFYLNLEAGSLMTKVDPGQFDQLLMNLVVNARDAVSERGHIVIETKREAITDSRIAESLELPPGNYIMVAVHDNGCGMTEEVKAKCFDPFFTTKGEGRGTGLGLSTVYGIIKQFGGTIAVESAVGEGTSMMVYLPEIMEKKPQDILDERIAQRLPGSSETILIVEDDVEIRKMISKIMAPLGYNLIEAKDGAEGLELFLKMDKPADMVITDVVMPNMGGMEMMAKISQKYPKMKVLYISGYTSEDAQQEGILELDKNFIHKPFFPEKLAKIVREILDRK
jgi:CheY-like chemotaxis protein